MRAGLLQAGQDLVFTVRTTAAVPLAKLDLLAGWQGRLRPLPLPGAAPRRPRASGGSASAAPKRAPPGRAGAAQRRRRRRSAKQRSPREVKRPSAGKLVVSLLPGRRRAGAARATAGGCSRARRLRAPRPRALRPRSLPATATRAFRLRPVRAVGCTGGGAGLVTNGPRDRNVVALTFDDGPSEYTPGFLDVLREKHVDGTFFEIGQEMPGREATMRQILARRQRDRRPHDEPRRIPRLLADRRRRSALIERLHPLQALPLPARRAAPSTPA